MRALNPMSIFTLCIVFVCLVCLSAGETTNNNAKKEPGEEHPSQVPKIFDYGEYVEKFKKSYSPLETLYKAKLFFGRTFKIFQHNVLYTQNKVAYFLRQNVFTDMPASELKKDKEPELSPVVEALKNPDLPADRLASVRKLRSEDGEEFSQASFDDLRNNAKYDAGTQKVKPVLNFMENQDIPDMKVVLRQLKQMPEFASRAAEMVDLREELPVESVKDKSGSKVLYKPVVESNNENYEPQVSMSYGTFSDVFKNAGKNYANFLMGDPDFENILTPYPDQRSDEDKKADGYEMEEDKSTLTMLIDSVKGVANFFFSNDEDEDEDAVVAEEQEKLKETEAAKLIEEQLTAVKAAESHNQAKYNIDWRYFGCISPVQNQKTCDSCYAFTVLSLMEFFYCRQTQQLTTFSAQYIVDCGQKVNLNGCRGSKIGNVGQFIKNYGIELDSKYPYNAAENECPYDFNDAEQEMKSGYLRPIITHWQNFQEMVAWYKWLRKSPVIVGINMPADFLAYGGGVHDGLDCVSEMTHAMLLVGSGVQDGREFWLLKNSYSEMWGEEGYFKLSKSAPLRCFNSAIVARAKFITNQGSK